MSKIGDFLDKQIVESKLLNYKEKTMNTTVSKVQILQDLFLNAIRKNKTPVSIYLVNGIQLKGTVSSFDKYCLILKNDSSSQLVYKSSISTILPSVHVNFAETRD